MSKYKNIRSFIIKNSFHDCRENTVIFKHFFEKEGFEWNITNLYQKCDIEVLEKVSKKVKDTYKYFFFRHEAIEFLNENLKKYGIRFEKNKSISKGVYSKKIGVYQLFSKKHISRIIEVFEDKRLITIDIFLKNEGLNLESFHSILKFQKIKRANFCYIRNQSVFWEEDLKRAYEKSKQLLPTPIFFDAENSTSWKSLVLEFGIQKSSWFLNITSHFGPIFFKYKGAYYTKHPEEIREFIKKHFKLYHGAKIQNQTAVIESWNKRRSEEWRIDLKNMTFRGQKVYNNEVGRWITESGFDICFEYYKTVESDISNISGFQRAVNRNFIKSFNGGRK